MSEDDYDTVPPPKIIKEFPKGWVLKFDDDDDAFYYNRTLKVKPTRTPIDASEFKAWKIKVNKKCVLKIDKDGDPYYICINEGKQETSRTPPVSMKGLFPYGIELLLTSPFYKELDENKMITIEKPQQKEKEKEKEKKVKTDLAAYLEALAKGIHCDENMPCDKDHECDLENKMCVPKSDKSYYDDLKRHEEDGASFVGKSATIQKLIDSITSKKKKKEDDEKAEKAAKKQKKEDDEKATKKREEEEKASKKKQKKRKEEEDRKEAEADDEDELNVDDVLDPDYENLSALQKALMDCLVPK